MATDEKREDFVLLQGYSRKYDTRLRVIEHPGVLPYKDHFVVLIDCEENYTGGQEVPINKAGRLRDGGTTTIELTDGRLIHRPAPRLNKPNRFDGEEIVCGCKDCVYHYRNVTRGEYCDCTICEGKRDAERRHASSSQDGTAHPTERQRGD